MPLLPNQYQIAIIYMISKLSRNSNKDEGVQIIKNEIYKNRNNNINENIEDKNNKDIKNKDNAEGRYSEKIYHLGNNTPDIIKKICPENVLKLHESSWNLYPERCLNSCIRNLFLVKLY